MVAHLDEKEIRILKALHKAPVPKPFNDSAADSNADTVEAYSPPRISAKLREEKPWLLVVSSLCIPLSQLQHWNFSTTKLSKDKMSIADGLNQAPCICSGVVLGTGRSWEKVFS